MSDGAPADAADGGSEDGSRKLTRQGAERKQQLLDQAARLFAERGYDETRVIDIVRAAGVAKGLFYWYFENKEALFRELLESTRLKLRVAQAEAIDDEASPLLRIRQGVEATVRFNSQHRRLYSLLDLEVVGREFSDVVRQGADTHARDTARHVADGIRQGQIRDEEPLLLAHAVVSMVMSFGMMARTRRLLLDVDQLGAFTGRMVVGALAANSTVVADLEREAALLAARRHGCTAATSVSADAVRTKLT